MGDLEVSVTQELNNNPDFRGILRFPEGITAREGTKRIARERKLSKQELEEERTKGSKKTTKKTYDSIDTTIYTFPVFKSGEKAREINLIDLKETSGIIRQDYDTLEHFVSQDHDKLLPEEIVSARAATKSITQKKNETLKYKIEISTKIIDILSNNNIKRASKINKGETAYFRIKENISLLGANGKSIKAAREIKKDLQSIPQHWRDHLEEEFELSKKINAALARKPKPERVIKPKKQEFQGEVYKELYQVENLTPTIKQRLDRNYDNLSKKISFLREFLESPHLYDETQVKRLRDYHKTILRIGKQLEKQLTVIFSPEVTKVTQGFNKYLANQQAKKAKEKKEANRLANIRSKEQKDRRTLEQKIKNLNISSAQDVSKNHRRISTIRGKIEKLSFQQHKNGLNKLLEKKIDSSIEAIINEPLLRIQKRLSEIKTLLDYERVMDDFDRYYKPATRALELLGTKDEERITNNKLYSQLFFEFDTYKYAKKVLGLATHINTIKRFEGQKTFTPEYLRAINNFFKVKDTIRRIPDSSKNKNAVLKTRFYEMIQDKVPEFLDEFMNKKQLLLDKIEQAGNLFDALELVEEGEKLTSYHKIVVKRIRDTNAYKKRVRKISNLNSRFSSIFSKDSLARLTNLRDSLEKITSTQAYEPKIFTNYVTNLDQVLEDSDLSQKLDVKTELNFISQQLLLLIQKYHSTPNEVKRNYLLDESKKALATIKKFPSNSKLRTVLSDVEYIIEENGKGNSNIEKTKARIDIAIYPRSVTLEEANNIINVSLRTDSKSISNLSYKGQEELPKFGHVVIEQDTREVNEKIHYRFRSFVINPENNTYNSSITLAHIEPVETRNEPIYHLKISFLGKEGEEKRNLMTADIKELMLLLASYQPTNMTFELKRIHGVDILPRNEESSQAIIPKIEELVKPVILGYSRFSNLTEVPIHYQYGPRNNDKIGGTKIELLTE